MNNIQLLYFDEVNVWIFLLLKKDILNKKKRWPGELKTGGVFS
jgi:hypothetical protein